MRIQISTSTLLACFVVLSACSSSNNLMTGTVQADIGTHHIVVTDCYRTSFPPPENGRFAPCRDAIVVIERETLTVNDRTYGRLNPSDSVLVDHGVVSVKRSDTGPIAAN